MRKTAISFIVLALIGFINPVIANSNNLTKDSQIREKSDKKIKKNKKDKIKEDFYMPWQSEKSKKIAIKNRANGKANANKSNFSRYQRTRLYYKIQAKKAMKKSSYSKASAPKHKKNYIKKRRR